MWFSEVVYFPVPAEVENEDMRLSTGLRHDLICVLVQRSFTRSQLFIHLSCGNEFFWLSLMFSLAVLSRLDDDISGLRERAFKRNLKQKKYVS